MTAMIAITIIISIERDAALGRPVHFGVRPAQDIGVYAVPAWLSIGAVGR